MRVEATKRRHKLTILQYSATREDIRALPEAKRTKEEVSLIAARHGVRFMFAWDFALAIGCQKGHQGGKKLIVIPEEILAQASTRNSQGETFAALGKAFGYSPNTLYEKTRNWRHLEEIRKKALEKPQRFRPFPVVTFSSSIRPLTKAELMQGRAKPAPTIPRPEPEIPLPT